MMIWFYRGRGDRLGTYFVPGTEDSRAYITLGQSICGKILTCFNSILVTRHFHLCNVWWTWSTNLIHRIVHVENRPPELHVPQAFLSPIKRHSCFSTYLVFQTIFNLTNLSQVNAPLSMCKLEYCKKFALIDNKIKPKRFSFIIFAVVVDLTDNIIMQ